MLVVGPAVLSLQELRPESCLGFARLGLSESLGITKRVGGQGNAADMSNTAKGPTFLNELTSVSLYKRSQGQTTRLVTVLAIVAVSVLGAVSLSQTTLSPYNESIRFGIPGIIAALGCWFGFRLVNWPRFAEFLISVQAEMDKVSWASKTEIIRATMVVLGTMFILGLALFLYDMLWFNLLSAATILGV